MAKKVLSGLVTAWRLAGRPTRRSPLSVNATIDGVILAPSAFSSTLGLVPSMTATQELVVPRSMPMTLPILHVLSLVRRTVRTRYSAPGFPQGPHDPWERDPLELRWFLALYSRGYLGPQPAESQFNPYMRS